MPEPLIVFNVKWEDIVRILELRRPIAREVERGAGRWSPGPLEWTAEALQQSILDKLTAAKSDTDLPGNRRHVGLIRAEAEELSRWCTRVAEKFRQAQPPSPVEARQFQEVASEIDAVLEGR